MKNSSIILILIVALFSACKDNSPPSFDSFKINDLDINLETPLYSASINQTLDMEFLMSDDEELLQFIMYIDSTGNGTLERLASEGLTGTDGYAQYFLPMSRVDSLSNRHFNNQPLPIYFEVSDAQLNTKTVVVSFNVE